MSSEKKQEEIDYTDYKPFLEQIQKAAALIDEADAIIILTGAGMGVGSGLGTFRGKNQGIWPPLIRLGMEFPEMSNPTWFQKDPELGWSFWYWRYVAYTSNLPHSGYYLLKELVKQKPLGGFSITSNIDGHWEECGFPSDKVYEVHGTLRFLQCSNPSPECEEKIWKTELKLEIDPKTDKALSVPKCIHCKTQVARPNVLMFGDGGWMGVREDVQVENLNQFVETLSEKKVVGIEIGAGGAVPTIRRMSKTLSKNNYSFDLIRINPEQPSMDSIKGISLPLNGEVALVQINKFLKTPVVLPSRETSNNNNDNKN